MPVALQLAQKARATVSSNPVARLYRSIIKEVPRVLTIYDIDLPLDEARSTIRKSFDKYKDVKDQRVIDMLIEVGYMDLEETLLQHKQRSHLIRNFSGMVEVKGAARKRVMAGSTIDEQFARGY
mmetsp:Transcript_17424/g.24603  ORF Transcript_17424/g.24603 Transcript_17424/m.24603 type:complete len:124 (+) Transcript_17424:90-461(+)|eukprot:CAMPEP_0184856424 /NCGR_PEP_ID=MMETSP0580-20130426/1614_1 /TAXON_ID=1118495 /ORGANISM="Dactyliosolen fragilissimus" /LENGTH=123 /DNA_ID=CAMNT_0027351449 /DNA_START=64 /DNA_END=435 /DNA_ORIENTATION=-